MRRFDGADAAESFQTPEVAKTGSLAALKDLGKPADVLRETKERMFSA